MKNAIRRVGALRPLTTCSIATSPPAAIARQEAPSGHPSPLFRQEMVRVWQAISQARDEGVSVDESRVVGLPPGQPAAIWSRRTGLAHTRHL